MAVKRWIVVALCRLCGLKDRLIAQNTCDLAKLSYVLDQKWGTGVWRDTANKGD